MNRRKKTTFRPTLLLLALCAGWSLPAWGLSADESTVDRDRYLEALRLLASQGIEAASDALIELEMAVAQQRGASGLDQLREIELGVANELTQIDANLLLPLIALHERTHVEYRRQPLEANPYHARAAVYLQTLLFSERSLTPQERSIASDLFVSLAGYFQEGSAGPGAVGLYTRALQFDPNNTAALLGLATAREQTGRYRNALTLLERLVETGAADAETRLRLAINLERLGKQGEAERILENLLAESAEDWVLTLAFQQLARIRMDQERFEAAQTYLARGLARFPDDFSLAVGLAYVEERLSLKQEEPLANHIAKRDSAFAGSSARYRYARPGYEYVEVTREQLRDEARSHLPDLADALSTLAVPE